MVDLTKCLYKYVDLSTAHISPGDEEILGIICNYPDNVITQLCVYSYEFGYWIYIGYPANEIEGVIKSCEEVGFSKEFQEIIRESNRVGANMLRLDADGTFVDGLKEFDW